MNRKLPAVLIIVVAIISVGVVAYFALGIYDNVMAQTGSVQEQNLSGQVPVGILSPITGVLSNIGGDYLAITHIAAADVNEYLNARNEPWTMKLLIEDTESNPDITLEKTKDLHAQGVNVFVGPVASPNVHAIKKYVDENDILVLACCSSASAVAIPDDNIYRLSTVDTHFIGIYANAITSHGIDNVIHVYRGDVWGDGIDDAFGVSFPENGGTVSNWIRYNPETADYADVARHIHQMVEEVTQTTDSDKVGVLLSSYGEYRDIIREAASYEILDDVKWLGIATPIDDQHIADDPVVAEFVNKVQLFSVTLPTPEGQQYLQVKAAITERLGYEPNPLIYSAYDAVWIMALTMIDAQTTNIDDLKAHIVGAAENYGGVTGTFKFNDAGDLADIAYDVLRISDGQWNVVGKYTPSDGYVILDRTQ